jgi:site-specific DNA-methyltransferase (adenine-specific)/adenine-specific DNA-methyltransferase
VALNTIQKPEKLIQRLVLASSNPGDLVLDPFAGVGTCPFVCKKHDRRFIAFEINENFVKKANERLLSLESGQQVLDLAHGA